MTTPAAPWLTLREGAAEIRVKVVPRSSREQISGVIGDRLKVLLHSPPVEGEANRALIQVIASAAGLAASRVRIVSGAKDRSKTLRIECEDPAGTAAILVDEAGRTR